MTLCCDYNSDTHKNTKGNPKLSLDEIIDSADLRPYWILNTNNCNTSQLRQDLTLIFPIWLSITCKPQTRKKAFIYRISLHFIHTQGSKLQPIQSHLRLKFFPLRLKYLKESQISDLFLRLLFRNKRVTSCQFAATLTKKIKKENCFVSCRKFSFNLMIL